MMALLKKERKEIGGGWRGNKRKVLMKRTIRPHKTFQNLGLIEE